MSNARLDFLRHTVVPHLQKMPTIDDIREKHDNYVDQEVALQNSAVLNLDMYVVHSSPYELDENLTQKHDYYDVVGARGGEGLDEIEKISDEYNCGFAGCFAGWYVLLARKHNFLSEKTIRDENLMGYNIDFLAAHFDITTEEAENLFRAQGGGCEDAYDDTREALAARVARLDTIIEGV